ncbi:hypothetical protein SDC9_158289 [bioreactor metagenome]|uniref:Uncharacterized protein n=1 Tax=bioreactor metagenome TaxID=1076179 RepID=A0A645F9M0_9ZZZZ
MKGFNQRSQKKRVTPRGSLKERRQAFEVFGSRHQGVPQQRIDVCQGQIPHLERGHWCGLPAQVLHNLQKRTRRVSFVIPIRSEHQQIAERRVDLEVSKHRQ